MQKYIKYLLVGLILFSTIFLGYKYAYKPNTVTEIKTEDAFNLNDKELLVGWSDNVFIGTVVAKVKEEKDDISPCTTYSVKVVENIKGTLSGIIDVRQRIGYDNDKKQLVKIKGDNYLDKGSKYLFVAKYDESTKSYFIVPVHGDIKINDTEHEKKLKAEFKKAKENQKKPEGI